MEASTQQEPRAPEEMSEAERQAEIRRLRGGKPGAAERQAVDEPGAVGEGEEFPVQTRREAVKAAAEGESLSGTAALDATEWFLSTEEDGESDLHEFDLNVGTTANEKWVRWTVRAMDVDELRRIRKESMVGSRAQRRAGAAELDETAFNLKVAARATVVPDLVEMARSMGSNDPDQNKAAEAVLKHRMRKKPGLIAQITGEVMDFSGYDEENVREVEAAKN